MIIFCVPLWQNIKFMKTFALSLAIVCGASMCVAGELPAFPGAEGFGMYASGGRGGDVYHVTTLEDTGEPGSLRYACDMPGPRTVVFDVDGTIFLKSQLRIENPDLTIAGQTASGDGICIADYPVLVQADNVILRFLRFRLGDRQMAHHEGDGLGGSGHRNIIVDHCSVSWSIDECISVYGMTDCTVQWCIGSHSLNSSGHKKGEHGYGGNWGGSGISYHHNLLANHKSRTPRLGPSPHTQLDERMDLRNNVYYNYGSGGCYGGEGMTVNIINNYYKPGVCPNNFTERIASPGIRTLRYCLDRRSLAEDYSHLTGISITPDDITPTRRGTPTDGDDMAVIGDVGYIIDMQDSTITVAGEKIKLKWNRWVPMLHRWGQFYVDGNVNHRHPEVTADNWTLGVLAQIDTIGNDGYWDEKIKASIRLDEPMDHMPVTTHTAEEAYELVLARAGASLHRDAYDEAVIKDVAAGTASFGNYGIINSQDEIVYSDGHRGWPALISSEPLPDTDGDGMPDAWELSQALDPADASDGKHISPSGYTYLEEYLNSLVDHIMSY